MQYEEANIINLSYTSLNEEYAKEFSEALIDEMSRMYIAHQTKQSNNTSPSSVVCLIIFSNKFTGLGVIWVHFLFFLALS